MSIGGMLTIESEIGDRKAEKSSDCVERSRFEVSGPSKGHRKSWAENFQGMRRFDV
jgi:hypothetical protein